MSPLMGIGKMLLLFGVVLVVIGGLIMLAGKIPGIGRLPGDIYVQKGNISFYFPVVTSIILSIILTVLLNLFLRR